MSLKRCRQAGMSMPIVILILGILTIAAAFFRKDIAKAVFPKNPYLQVTYKIERESKWLSPDKYYLVLSAYHQAEEAVDGRLQFTFIGDCKFQPPDAESMKSITILKEGWIVMQTPRWEPGGGNSKVVRCELVNPKLNQNWLSDDEVKSRIFVQVGAGFIPHSESIYRESIGTLVIGRLPDGTIAGDRGRWKND